MFEFITNLFEGKTVAFIALCVAFVALGVSLWLVRRNRSAAKGESTVVPQTEVLTPSSATIEDEPVSAVQESTDSNMSQSETSTTFVVPKRKVSEFTPRQTGKKHRPPSVLRRRLRMTPAVSPATVVTDVKEDVADSSETTNDDTALNVKSTS